MSDLILLSLIVFVPTLGALALLVFPRDTEPAMKWFALGTTAVTLVLTLWALAIDLDPQGPAAKLPLAERAAMAHEAARTGQPVPPGTLVGVVEWIRPLQIEYYLGADGISMSLLVLTALICLLSMAASWSITQYVRAYCILFLVLETGMLGTFLALDFFLFYIFWEIVLLPMYFLIGIWGAPSRVDADGRVRGGPYAAIKFFLYTVAGGVLMLLALLGFYFTTGGFRSGTFDIMRLQAIGQAAGSPFGRSFQLVMFVLLFIGFAIKVPVFPFHTWLPDAHVEAPTPISMILAGVLLKMGGYGMIRIAWPICPQGAMILAWPLAVLGVWNILYGALAAMAQTDFKKLVAYSSVSHMGYVLLGIAVWGYGMPSWSTGAWSLAMTGAMYVMLAHGISSPGMFFCVGVIYDRLHHRDLRRLGGVTSAMPVYSGLAFVIFFAALGLPGLCGFIGEAFVVLGAWSFSKLLAALAAAGVLLTAGYILWTIQRVFFGENEAVRGLPEMSLREGLVAAPLAILCVLLGIFPVQFVLRYVQPSVEQLVHQMSAVVPRVAAVLHVLR